MTRILRTALCLMAACVLCEAQTVGRITGVVTDPTSLPVTDAAIQVTSLGTGETWRAATNLSGVYMISPLPVGDYSLEVRKGGFKIFARKGLRIDALSSLTIDVRLELGSVAESVTVDAAAPIIETERRDIGNSRYAVQLENLPIYVREVQTLVGQTAGAPYGNQGTIGGVWQNQGRVAMQVLADGVQVNAFQSEAWPAIGGIGRRADLTIPGIEVLSEVKLTSSGGNAEYMQPVQVIAATKSGTNELHGSLFEFYRSGGLGARRWENADRDSFVRHQSGGAAGGPVKKNKMFFFAGFESYRFTRQVQSGVRYPTAAERSGDLSDMLQRTDARGAPAPVRLFDPLASGQNFPNNVIPASRINPISAELLKLIPAGTVPAGNLADYNATFWKPQYDSSDKYDARIDHTVGARDRMFGRMTVSRLDQAFAYGGNVSGPYGMSGKKEWTHAAVLNWTRIVNPSTIGVFQFTFRNFPFNNSTSDEGQKVFPGINGINPEPPWAGPPSVAIGSNALGIGGPPPVVTGQTANTQLLVRSWGKQSADYAYTFDPSVTKVVANHTLKAGFTFLRGYKTKWPGAAPFGAYTTASDFNNARSTVSATGDAFGDYLLGYPSTSDVVVGPSGCELSKTNFSFFLQDDWKLTSRLTLNLGIRYDRLGFFDEMNKMSSKGSFRLGKIVIQDGSQSLIQPAFKQFSDRYVTASEAGLPSTFILPNNRDFAPRIGLAYRVTPSFVLRGGFGLYNVDITLNPFEGGMTSLPPFSRRYNLSRSQLISGGVDVNSVYTFQNPTASGTGVGADTQLTAYNGPLDTYPTQRAYTWSFTLEKDFARQYGLRMSYLGNVGRRLSRVVRVNACAPGPVQCLSRPASDPTGRRWPQFDMNLGSQQANGQSEFHSVEIELQKRFSGGLFMDVNYAYARLFAYADASDPVKNPMSHYDWGTAFPSGQGSGQPNSVFHWNHVYELPFGKGRRFGSSMSGLANVLAGGWMLSGVGTWQSGPALNITTSNGQTPTGATTNRADRVGNGNLDHSGRSRGQNAYQWFDTTAFRQPAFVDPAAPNRTYMFGSSPIGVLRGPSFFTYDTTVQKVVTVRERWKLQLRAQVLNPFNIPMLGSPDTNVASGTFGRIRSSFAAYNDSYGPRTVEFGLRLSF